MRRTTQSTERTRYQQRINETYAKPIDPAHYSVDGVRWLKISDREVTAQ